MVESVCKTSDECGAKECCLIDNPFIMSKRFIVPTELIGGTVIFPTLEGTVIFSIKLVIKLVAKVLKSIKI